MSNQHVLKIHPAPLADLLSGAKTAEVRRNDRAFQVGDTVRLMEVNPETGNWTGAADQVCTITHIQTGYGLPDDLCVLSYGKVGHDYKAHWMGFMDRTDWMQEKGQVPAKYLGQHRADILTDMLLEAREALARLEAELSDIRHKAFTAAMARDTAQEQLAEAVRLMREVEPHKVSEELETLFRAFLARYAQTEQQEAQGAQAGDDPLRKALERIARDHGCGCLPCHGDCRSEDAMRETADAMRDIARAALATQPAAGEPKPIGYISEAVHQELLNGKHVPANICTATPSRRNPHPGPDANWSVPIFAAPPAAPHGDEAVQYRLLRVGEVIKATDELLMDDCTTWHPMGDGPQIGIGWGWHAGLMPVRRIDAAMRAKGEGD